MQHLCCDIESFYIYIYIYIYILCIYIYIKLKIKLRLQNLQYYVENPKFLLFIDFQ